MNNKTKLFIMAVIVLLGAYFGGLVYIMVHENVHTNIFKSYGVSSTTQINWGLSGWTIANIDQINSLSNQSLNAMVLANNFTDVSGYHVAIILFNLWLMLSIFIFYKVILENNGNNTNKG